MPTHTQVAMLTLAPLVIVHMLIYSYIYRSLLECWHNWATRFWTDFKVKASHILFKHLCQIRCQTWWNKLFQHIRTHYTRVVVVVVLWTLYVLGMICIVICIYILYIPNLNAFEKKKKKKYWNRRKYNLF